MPCAVSPASLGTSDGDRLVRKDDGDPNGQTDFPGVATGKHVQQEGSDHG